MFCCFFYTKNCTKVCDGSVENCCFVTCKELDIKQYQNHYANQIALKKTKELNAALLTS